MRSIKLMNKKTGKIHECDVYLSGFPQMIAVEILGDTEYSYSSFRGLMEDWEVAGEEE